MAGGTSQLSWGGYTFDAVIREGVADGAEVTLHPLEDGSVIADHIIQMPTPVQAEIVQSDIPADGTPYQEGRADSTYLSLLQDLATGTISDLVTSVRAFPSMVLVGVERTRSRPEAAARMLLRWMPVRTVAGVTVDVPVASTSTVAAASVEVGKEQAEQPAAATVAKGASILSRLTGG